MFEYYQIHGVDSDGKRLIFSLRSREARTKARKAEQVNEDSLQPVAEPKRHLEAKEITEIQEAKERRKAKEAHHQGQSKATAVKS